MNNTPAQIYDYAQVIQPVLAGLSTLSALQKQTIKDDSWPEGGAPPPLTRGQLGLKVGNCGQFWQLAQISTPSVNPPLSEGAEGNVKEGDDHE